MNRKSAFTAIFFGFLLLPLLSLAITVGPTRLEYSVDPGAVIKGQVHIYNEGQAAQTFYPNFEKFTEVNGQKVFLKEEADLASWIETAKSVHLAAGEGADVPFTINVPKNAPPGGHFAVIWWSSTPPGPAGKQVSIVTRAGILVYLRVSGNVVESADVSFSSSRIFMSLPISLSVNFKNTGNSYLKPYGTFKLKNIFGGTAASLPFNEFGSNILPQSQKSFDLTVNSAGWFFGPYRAEADLTYGDSNKTLSRSYWILILPIRGVIIFLLGLAVIFFAIPRGIKKYNRWIVNRVQKMSESTLKADVQNVQVPKTRRGAPPKEYSRTPKRSKK